MGVRIRGTFGDIDPLNKLPFKRARNTVPLLVDMPVNHTPVGA